MTAVDQTATGQAVAGVTSVTFTWPTLPSPGSKAFVVLAVSSGSVGVSSAVDNGTSASTFTGDVAIAPGSHSGKYILRADGISRPASGSYAVTVTFSGTVGFATGSGRTYTGVAAGAPTGTVSNSGTSGSVTTGNLTPAVAGALIVGGFDDDSSANPETITLTTSGASNIFTEANGASFLAGAIADHIVSTTGAQGLAWTLGDAPDWGAWAAVYSPVAQGSSLAGSLVPPGISSPMAFKRHAWPTAAPVLATGADTGSGPDSGTAGSIITGSDTGSGADAGSPGFKGADAGSGSEAGSVTATVHAADTGSGADVGSSVVPVSGADTGHGAEGSSLTVRTVLTARWKAPDRLNKSGGTMGP